MEGRCGQHFVKQATKAFLTLGFILSFGIFIFQMSTFAADWDYDACIDKSGGRDDIPSVQWACGQTEEGVNACSAWIGSSTDSSSLDVYIESLSGTIDIAYWGMCTDYEDTTSELWVDNDNDSIGDSKDLTRGTWGSPKKLKTTLDIGKFVDGVTPVQTDEGAVYTRDVEVGRCNGENEESCSTQGQNINLILPSDSFEARATSTEVADDQSSVTSGWTNETVKGSDNKLENIPCSNTGCDVTYTFDIERTTMGNKNTSWAIQKRSATKNSNGDWEWYNTGDFGIAPGGSGNMEISVKSFTKTLNPNTTTCYRIAFNPSSNDTDTIKTVATCAQTLPVTFQDYSKVSLNGTTTSATTGWKTTGNINDNTAWLELNDCNDGCDITFSHGIQRTQGLNTATSTFKVSGAGLGEENGTYATNSPSPTSKTIYTGQVYCRKLEFDRKIAYDDDAGSVKTTRGATRACAYAVGTYSSDIDIKVKKSTSSAWLDTSSANPIYAKPTDVINLRGTYSPKYQHTYNFKPRIIKIGSTSITNNGVNTIQNVFNSAINPNWNNAFSIKLDNGHSAFSELAESSTIGSNNTYTSDRDYTVSIQDPGESITATALTNDINGSKTTPKQVEFTYTRDNSTIDNFTATINNDSISDPAYIKVPYNFNNTTCIISSNSSENDESGCIKPDLNRIAYAGETKKVDYQIKVGQRLNSTVGDTYATIVKNAKWKLRICINESDNCIETNEESDNLNKDGLLTGATESKDTTINIPDAPAGTRLCVYSMVSPTSVNGDTDLSPSGNGAWGISPTPSCFTIAKKPILQVLGGNIYSGGNITTATSVKKHLSGIDEPYNPNNTASYANHVFGSWGELGIIATGTIKGFSSGASLAYPTGSIAASICNRSPLTFANYPCYVNQGVGKLGNSIAVNNIQNNKATLVSEYIFGGDANVADTVDLNQEADFIKKDSIYYYHGAGDLAIPSSLITKRKTKIVHADGNITITGNLLYEKSDYSSFDDMPKLIIYANNIAIDCSVSEIDAILVAQDQVITCNNFDHNYDEAISKATDHINDPINSHPFIVNGAIIASRLIANRTYGAATGINSGVPAETINFDPALYSWSDNRMEGKTVITNLDVVYQHELAPRY